MILAQKIRCYSKDKFIKCETVIVNCIGYTNVENCEINPEKANEVNVELPSFSFYKYANSLCIKLVHISTDHLFDGKINYCNDEQL